MMRSLAAGILGAVLTMAPIVGHAGVVFTLGNNPQPDEENILLNTGTSGSEVFGVTNQSNLQVRFSSTTDILSEPANGQARVEAEDDLVNNITIDIPGGAYVDLILNPFSGEGDATVTVELLEPDGSTIVANFVYELANGQNFLTIVAIDGERILSTTIDAPEGFEDLRQPRISGAQLLERVPEPGIALLLGSALGAVALLGGRKRR
jgi:hypothetical protein